jgi:hypothetical protein
MSFNPQLLTIITYYFPTNISLLLIQNAIPYLLHNTHSYLTLHLRVWTLSEYLVLQAYLKHKLESIITK